MTTFRLPDGSLVRARVVEEGGEAGTTSEETEAGEEGAAEEIEPAAAECIHLLEGGAPVERCVEAPNPILPAKNEVFWGGLSFLVLLLLMAKFAMPAVQKAMQTRTDRIRNSLDEAERTRGEAQQILEEYQRQLADARAESGRIIEEARQAADQMRRDIIQRAEAEAADLRARSQADVVAAQDRALGDLKARVGDIAIDLAEKVVERTIDRQAQNQLIESFITRVGGQN